MSVDPHPGDQDDPSSLNEYLYTANNPINRIDPDGDKWQKWAKYGLIAGGIALSFTGVGGIAGGIIINAALDGAGTYLDGGSAKDVAKSVIIGAAIGAGSFGAGKLVSKAAKNIKNARAVGNSGTKFFSKSPKNANSFKTTSIGKKYTEFSYEVPAKKAGPPARAVYKKAVNKQGKTIRVVKDTYSKSNRLIHRKFK